MLRAWATFPARHTRASVEFLARAGDHLRSAHTRLCFCCARGRPILGTPERAADFLTRTGGHFFKGHACNAPFCILGHVQGHPFRPACTTRLYFCCVRGPHFLGTPARAVCFLARRGTRFRARLQRAS